MHTLKLVLFLCIVAASGFGCATGTTTTIPTSCNCGEMRRTYTPITFQEPTVEQAATTPAPEPAITPEPAPSEPEPAPKVEPPTEIRASSSRVVGETIIIE